MRENSMFKLMKYEFRSMRSYFFIFAAAVLLVPLAGILIDKNAMIIQTLITIPILLIFLVTAVTAFNNEIAREREQLIYQTPNSIHKILGAKLLNEFILVLFISILINIINMITGYVPFIGPESFHSGAVLPEEYKNTIRLFSVMWNSTIILALIATFNFVTAVNAAVFRLGWVNSFLKVVIGLALFYGLLCFVALVMRALPMNLVLSDEVTMRYNNFISIERLVNGQTSSSSWFSLDSQSGRIAVYYQSGSVIILGLSSVIANILIVAIFYPITAWILKRRVFA